MPDANTRWGGGGSEQTGNMTDGKVSTSPCSNWLKHHRDQRTASKKYFIKATRMCNIMWVRFLTDSTFKMGHAYTTFYTVIFFFFYTLRSSDCCLWGWWSGSPQVDIALFPDSSCCTGTLNNLNREDTQGWWEQKKCCCFWTSLMSFNMGIWLMERKSTKVISGHFPHQNVLYPSTSKQL